MKTAVAGFVALAVLLTGCGAAADSTPSSPATRAETPAASSSRPITAVYAFRDPLGYYTLECSADLVPHVDPTAFDYWGDRASYVTFTPRPGSAIDGCGSINVETEDAKTHLSAAEAAKFWAKNFDLDLAIAKADGIKVTPSDRSKVGSATVYQATYKWKSGAVTRAYTVVDGTMRVAFMMRLTDHGKATMQSLLDQMTSSLQLL